MVAQYPSIEDLKMGGSAIREKIIETLESNGDLTTSDWRRLVLLALVDLSQGAENARICRDEIKKANERIDKLETYNLLMLAHKHPKWSIVFGAIAIFFVVSVISHLEMWGWIADLIDEYIGVPIP